MKLTSALGLVSLGVTLGLTGPACSAGGGGDGDGDGGGDGDGDGDGDINPGDGDGDLIVGDGDGDGDGDGGPDNPATCAIAADNRTYVGCDFWPTVTANPVYPVFDFAAVVANAGENPATITVERGGTMVSEVTVAPGELEKIALPWVDDLKGGNFNAETQDARTVSSTLSPGGAYHLTSDFPVTVWQFNPLQYTTDKTCTFPPSIQNGDGTRCLSVSNDASILIPSTALRDTYRLAGWKSGLDSNMTGTGANDAPPFYTVTATQDGTTVTVDLNSTSSVAAGTGVSAIAPSTTAEFDLNAGDVLQLVAAKDWNVDPTAGLGDLSGSLITASKPIQVISGVSIASAPDYATTCCGDHFEESLLPVEAWGNDYIVTGPTDATGANRGHFLRIVGNFDGTTLSYEGTTPAGAPTTIDAGEVWESTNVVTAPFRVTGSNPAGEKSSSFAIVSVLPGNGNSANFAGDPAMTFPVAVPQYRSKYIFLAPDDYETSYADIVAPEGATLSLDGAPLSSTPEPLMAGWVKHRELLNPANGGAHVLVSEDSSQPIGLNVAGYGYATGYIYPGGLNIRLISDIPVVVK